MRVLTPDLFEAGRRAALKSVGRMTSSNAKGMVIDIDYALDEVLPGASIRWRGGEDGLFTVEAAFSGTPQGVADSVIDSLVEVAYSEDRAIASIDVRATRFEIEFATWGPEGGLATVRIQADQRSTDLA